MEEKFEKMSEIKKIESLYEKIFNKKELCDFQLLMIKNVNIEDQDNINILECIIKMMFEEFIIYNIALYAEDGLNNIKALDIEDEIQILSYEHYINTYENYIKRIREYLKNNKNII